MMKFKFVPDDGVETDWQFEGLVWELDKYDDGLYMDGGHFSIPVDKRYRSLSSKVNRQGIFVEDNSIKK